jgi:4-hydroxybenzoate polyprenyltransferase
VRFNFSSGLFVICAGIIAGIAIFNNLESGIAMTGSLLLVFYLTMKNHVYFKRHLLFLLVTLPLPFLI